MNFDNNVSLLPKKKTIHWKVSLLSRRKLEMKDIAVFGLLLKKKIKVGNSTIFENVENIWAKVTSAHSWTILNVDCNNSKLLMGR